MALILFYVVYPSATGTDPSNDATGAAYIAAGQDGAGVTAAFAEDQPWADGAFFDPTGLTPGTPYKRAAVVYDDVADEYSDVLVSDVITTAAASSAITPADGVSTTSTLAGRSTARATATSADGASTAGTLTARSTARATITPAAGSSTASTLVGVGGTTSAITAAAGTSTTGTLAGSSTARATVSPADGQSTAGTLTGRSTARATITPADGVSTTSTLVPVVPGFAVITPAAGSSTTGTLVGRSTARASIEPATGVSTAGILIGRDANAPDEPESLGGPRRDIGSPAFTNADYMHWVAHTLGRVAATGVFDA
jgi:hypothetical protein